MKIIYKRKITLMEVMLIGMIFSIGLAIVIMVIKPPATKPSISQPAAKIEDEQILRVQNALKFYKLDNGFYPTTRQGLRSLVTKPTVPPIPQHWRPYLDAIPKDAEGREIPYSEKSDSPADSLGPS